MHDIERKPSRDDAVVEITDIPPQEEPQIAGDTGITPVTVEPKRSRRPFAMRFLAAGGIVLLVLAVIFSAMLFRSQPASQPGSGTVTTQNQPSPRTSPTATPASSSTSTSQTVFITIVGGVAYAGADGTVYALSTDNGTLLWRSSIDGAVGDQPVVASGVVYVTASTDSTATLYALRASDGVQLWHFATNGPIAPVALDGGTSVGPAIYAPIVANGVVYVGVEGDKVLALRAGDGTRLWQFSDHLIGLRPPQLFNGVVYVAAANDAQQGNVYALRSSDGRLLWHYKTGAFLSETTVIDAAAYVTSQDGMLIALRTSDGHQLWQRALGGGNLGTIWQPVQAFNGVLYVTTTKMSAPTASTSSPGLPSQALAMGSLSWGNVWAMPAVQTVPHKEGVSTLYAIQASDGVMLWHLTMNNGKNAFVSWLAVEEGVIYASVMDFSTPDTNTSHIYALRSATGSVLWHYDDTSTSPSGAVLVNGIIYLSAYSQDRNDVVYALRARDGSLLWRHRIGQSIFNAPVLDGTTVYVGAADGSVYALRAGNGAARWHHGAEAG